MLISFVGGRSIFIRVLLDKKYALPVSLIEDLVAYFSRFESCQDIMPVLWHQSLLTFCQRYKNEFTPDQVESITNLVSNKHHPEITPEILVELSSRDYDMRS